ncbi:unnamed protein product [Owenia fusiformis]|uniref:Uncharacterized protein n=1 Tax=Owenia fusiformis TaxID=6347 RepID=A0A8J1UWE4_OWEFU|nr:unnamed protein product [Owenia fusiformis]
MMLYLKRFKARMLLVTIICLSLALLMYNIFWNDPIHANPEFAKWQKIFDESNKPRGVFVAKNDSYDAIDHDDNVIDDPIDEPFISRVKQFKLNCSGIINGDAQVISETKIALHGSNKEVISSDYFITATKTCREFRKDFGYSNITVSDIEKEFPIAYILSVHHNVEQVEFLLRNIYSSQNLYCIHLDKKSTESFQDAIQYIARCFDNVMVSSKLENVVIGGPGRLKGEINCMRDLLNKDQQWKYAINLAGTDFPLKTKEEIVQHLKTLNGQNDIAGVEQFDESRTKYVHKMVGSSDNWVVAKTDELKQPPPLNISLYSGVEYYLASYKFVQHVVFDYLATSLLKWSLDTLFPEKTYWATLQRQQGTPGGTLDTTWRTMARIMKLKSTEGKYNPPCEGMYTGNVCVLGVEDLPYIANQDRLFAGKLDLYYDHYALYCMMERLAPSFRQMNKHIVADQQAIPRLLVDKPNEANNVINPGHEVVNPIRENNVVEVNL